MNTEREELIHLIHACLDGRATDAQASRLNALLREDAAVRDLYLQLADTHSCLAVDESLWMDPSALAAHPDLAVASVPKRWFVWRPLLSAAAGIVVGMLCTTVVFAYVGPSLVKPKTIFAESFESVVRTAPGLPRGTGSWGGDEAVVVDSAPGVKPRTGGRMLRFLSGTYQGENSPRSQWGDVYHIVDVRGLAGAGRTVARVSTNFAQAEVTGEKRFACSVGAFALDQDLSTLPSPLNQMWLQQNNNASGSRRAVLTEPGRWQEVSVELAITSQTRFLVLHLAVDQERPTLTSGTVHFSGHFMDDVKVELIPRH